MSQKSYKVMKQYEELLFVRTQHWFTNCSLFHQPPSWKDKTFAVFKLFCHCLHSILELEEHCINTEDYNNPTPLDHIFNTSAHTVVIYILTITLFVHKYTFLIFLILSSETNWNKISMQNAEMLRRGLVLFWWMIPSLCKISMQNLI